MKRAAWLRVAVCAISASIWLGSCTDNPFGGDEISSGRRSVRGKVVIRDDSPDDVFVWLDGFELSTRTDDQGNFQITLPPASGQNTSGGIDGVFRLYFFVANYGLKSAEVVVQDGEFLYSKGDVDNKGEIRGPVALNRFLKIKSEVAPGSVSHTSSEPVGIKVTLEATDSVTVVFPNSIGGLLGAAFLRNVETGQVFIVRSTDSELKDPVLITHGLISRILIFTLVNNPLPVGRYEVIPFVLIRHQTVPPGLLASLGGEVEELSPNYLNLPMKREVAILEIF